MDSTSLSFRKAGPDDVSDIAALVNAAYRGDSSRVGWTTEADLLGGQRIDTRIYRHPGAGRDSGKLAAEVVLDPGLHPKGTLSLCSGAPG